MDNIAILREKLVVPTHLVPFNIFDQFRATLKDVDGEDVNYEFFENDFEQGVTTFARGNLPLLYKHFKHVNIIDERSDPKLDYKIDFKESLYDYQEVVAQKVLAHNAGYGIIKAPARFGKTVLMVYLTTMLGRKTLFLAHQIDLLEQALETFYDMTNAEDLEKNKGRKIAGLVKKWSDIDKYDICFLTYQKFVTGKNADEMLEKYKDTFGLIWVDEAHKANALRYSKIVSSFNSRYRMGVTATVKTKTKTHVISEYVIGPVIAEGITQQVGCEVHLVNTRLNVPVYTTDPKRFLHECLEFLTNHKQRNQFIAAYIKAYADAGHICIAVTERTAMIDTIVKLLNDQGVRACAFDGRINTKAKRKEILRKTKTGEIQALISIRRMVLGLNIPCLSAFFNLTPSANPPNYYQEFSRVRTIYPNKLKGYIIDFIDNHTVLKGYTKSRLKTYKKQNFEIKQI